MTDEVAVAEHATTEHNDVELKALNQGWRPKDQFKGDLDSWVPADEFVRRGDLLAEISKRGKENKDLQKQLELIQKQFATVQQKSYEEALAKLKAEKEMAIESGDKYRVYDIENKIAQVSKPEVTMPVVSHDTEVNDFVHRNSSWFNEYTPENTAFKHAAIAYEKALPQNMSVSERLAKTESYMYSLMNKTVKDPVSSSTPEATPVKKTGKKTYDNLSEFEKRVCDKFVSCGAFKSQQDYVDALVAQEKSHQEKLNKGMM